MRLWKFQINSNKVIPKKDVHHQNQLTHIQFKNTRKKRKSNSSNNNNKKYWKLKLKMTNEMKTKWRNIWWAFYRFSWNKKGMLDKKSIIIDEAQFLKIKFFSSVFFFVYYPYSCDMIMLRHHSMNREKGTRYSFFFIFHFTDRDRIKWNEQTEKIDNGFRWWRNMNENETYDYLYMCF